jgi:hypothetical protein
MKTTTWKKPSIGLKILYYLWLLILPLTLYILGPILTKIIAFGHFASPGNEISFYLYLSLIIFGYVVGILLFKIKFSKTRDQFRQIYRNISLVKISIIIEKVLSENHVNFIINHDVIREGFVDERFDLLFKLPDIYAMLYVRENPSEYNSVRVNLQYSKISDMSMITHITRELDHVAINKTK